MLLVALVCACSSQPTDSRTDYYCSWETTEEAYQRCMEVSRELERGRGPESRE